LKLYALRDRLVDYFLTPFAAHSDKEVMASLAAAINTVGNNDAIAQSPQHFELWELATVEQDGTITPTRIFLADAHTLVRARREPEGPEAGGREIAPGRRRGPPSGVPGGPATYPATPEDQSPGTATEARDALPPSAATRRVS